MKEDVHEWGNGYDMKSSINVQNNVYAPKAKRKPHYSFESRHMDHLSTRITVQTAARCQLTRADAFTWSREHYAALWDPVRSSWIQRRTQMTVIVSSLKPNRRNTVCNKTVRRLFNLHISKKYLCILTQATIKCAFLKKTVTTPHVRHPSSVFGYSLKIDFFVTVDSWPE